MLLVERGSHVFGVPLASVQEAVAVTETLSLSGRKALDVRGTSIPFGDLAELLGADAPPLPPRAPAIIVAAGGRRVALACDRLIGESEVVVKALGPLLALGLRLPRRRDPRRRPRRAPARPGERHLDPQRRPPARAAERRRAEPGVSRTLLVVEDSFMVRELQRSILEAAGYRVVTAKHGREALEQLEAHSEIDLVVTDVDMPEMDGLALTEAIRASSEWQRSRSSWSPRATATRTAAGASRPAPTPTWSRTASTSTRCSTLSPRWSASDASPRARAS